MTCHPGVFVLTLTDDVKRALREDRPRVVKSLVHDGTFWREYKALVPDAYLISRQYYQHDWERALVVDGSDPANMLWAVHYATVDCPYDALLGPNEYIGEQDPDWMWHNAITTERQFAFQANQDGKAYFALSMSVGHLPPDWVVDQLAANPKVTGLSLHLYSCDQPLQQAPYYQRYVDFIRACPLPVLIGEVGRDCLAQCGWQQQNPSLSGADYTNELREATRLPAWAYTVFAHGCTDDWKARGFEHLDCAEFRDFVRGFDYSGFGKPQGGGMPQDYHHEAEIPESNYSKGRGEPLDTIMLHSTRGGTASPEAELAATLNWFRNPASQVSAHLVIAANGDYHYCVPWLDMAYHAKTYNARSIGIELVQRGPLIPFTDVQYKRLREALDYLCATYNIPYKRAAPGIIGHEAIDPQKSDPGSLFDWSRIGLGTPQPPDDWTLGQLREELRHKDEQLRVVTGERDALGAKLANIKAAGGW